MTKKNIAAILAAALMVISLSACSSVRTQADGQSGATEQTSQTAAKPKVDADASASIKGAASDQKEGQHTDSRRAVIYFSSPDSSDMNALEGSTQYLGRIIAEKTGADVFRIVPIKAYPTDYSAHTAQAKMEQGENARPAIQDNFGDLSQYDTIFLGYPIWWGDLPMPVYTFLESHDLSGKKIILFGTYGSSGLGDTVEHVRSIEKGADVETKAYGTAAGDVGSAKDKVLSWLSELGY